MTELENLKKQRSELTKRINELQSVDSKREVGRVRVYLDSQETSFGLRQDGSVGSTFRNVWQLQILKNVNKNLTESNQYVTVGNLPTKDSLYEYIDGLINDLTILKDKIEDLDMEVTHG